MKKLDVYKVLTDERLSPYVLLDNWGRHDTDRMYLARYAKYKSHGVFVTLGDTDFGNTSEEDAYIVDYSKLTKRFRSLVETYYKQNELEITLSCVMDHLEVTRVEQIRFNEIKNTKQLISIVERNFNTLCRFKELLTEYSLMSKIEKL